MRGQELSVARALIAPFTYKITIVCEHLDSLVARVCNVDAAVGCHRDAIRPVELPFAIASTTPLANEHSLGGELLDGAVTADLAEAVAILVGCGAVIGARASPYVNDDIQHSNPSL